MNKFKKMLATASIASIAIFTASYAAADTSLSQTGSVTISKGNTFSESTQFLLSSLSEVSGAVSIYKQAGSGAAALQSIAATLWYETGANTWTSVWNQSQSFSQSSKTAGWSAYFDESPLAAGTYKLTLAGSIFSSTKYSGYYNYQLSVSPVPEPEVYTMLGVGLAVVLLRLRKRKSTDSVALAA